MKNDPTLKMIRALMCASVLLTMAGSVVLMAVAGSEPCLVGLYDSPIVGTNNVTIVNDFAYLANYNDGMEILDISDPAFPVLLGSCSGYVSDIADGQSGLIMINVSDPSQPTYLSINNSAGNIGVFDVVLEGRYAYLPKRLELEKY